MSRGRRRRDGPALEMLIAAAGKGRVVVCGADACVVKWWLWRLLVRVMPKASCPSLSVREGGRLLKCCWWKLR